MSRPIQGRFAIGSWIMGLGAFAIAMTFKPVPMARSVPCRRELRG